MKNVDVLFDLLNDAFDLRRTQLCPRGSGSYEDEEIEEVEESVNDVTIKMIYKLNDTTFRPLFAKLTEWATIGLPEKDALGRAMRLTTFYKFLNTFFGTLKVSSSLYEGNYFHTFIQLTYFPFLVNRYWIRGLYP